MDENIITIWDYKKYLEKWLFYYSDRKNGYNYKLAKKIKRVRTFPSLNRIVREEILDDFRDYNKKDIKLAKQQIYNHLEKNWFEKDKKIAERNVKICKKAIELVDKFITIAEKEKLEISKSPYSNSFYLHKTGEKITWEGKPENSYRLSDHWNFYSWGEYHCISKEIQNDEFAIGIYRSGEYQKVI